MFIGSNISVINVCNRVDVGNPVISVHIVGSSNIFAGNVV